jgi:putative PEP-CTERM system histidine kinase
MVTRSIHALADLVESPGGAQWWRDERGDFRQSGRWNMPSDLPTIPGDDPFIGFLARTGWVVDVQDFMRRRDAYPGMEPPDWLLSLGNAWIVIPLPVADGLGGLVALTKPRTPVELNWEVLDLLKTAAKQAASVISQVRLAEALVEAQQFSAFNRMSAFVVHDLKNLVAQLSLMLKNAERHAANPEFQKDMRETIEHVVQRMQRLLLQLRSGTAPIENPAPVDVGAVIAGIKGAWGRQGRTVTASVGDELWAMGHTDRLERVLGHLVQNAFDAMEGRGTVDIEARQDGSFVLIEVRDHGKGMSPQFIRDELFKPFRSTKATGMGIGAYESQQYIQELGGRITVESEVGVGTRFCVSLPARDRKEASLDNDDKAA